jgi:hypothetical protein
MVRRLRRTTSGIQAAQQANEPKCSASVRQLGAVVEGGAQAVTQGLLHTQALKATAAVKERQASTLSFIDSNPYVPKEVLRQRMSPEDYTAWHAGLGDGVPGRTGGADVHGGRLPVRLRGQAGAGGGWTDNRAAWVARRLEVRRN